MAAEVFVFNVYNPTTGAPLTGAAASMSFSTYEDDLGNPLTHPTITEVGGGAYKFTPAFAVGRAICFVLSTGANNPTYLAGSIRPEDFSAWAYAPSPALVVFAVYDKTTGAPLTGVVNSFTEYADQGGVALAQPTIIEIGGGLYKFLPSFNNTNEVVFTISTAANNPTYVAGYLRVEDFTQTGFTVASVTAAPNQVTVAFGAGYNVDALSPTVTNPASWSIAGSPAVSISAVTLSNNTIVLTTSDQGSGASYTLNIPNGITANNGTFGLLGPFTEAFTGLQGDPTLIQARSVDERTVDIYFSYPPQTSRALDTTQYSISPALTVNGVTQMGPTWFRLTTGPQTIGTNYTITWPTH